MTRSARPRRLTRAESKARTFESLLGAAQRTFVERGYQGATLDAIAAEAGFTKGAVYAHFDSKEELLCVLFDRALRRDVERLEQMLDRANNDQESLIEQMGGYIDVVDERDQLPALGLELQIEARNNSKVSDFVRSAMQTHEQSVTRVIERYFNVIGGRPPIPAHQLAPTLVNLIVGFALARKARRLEGLSTAPIIRALLGLPPGLIGAQLDLSRSSSNSSVS